MERFRFGSRIAIAVAVALSIAPLLVQAPAAAISNGKNVTSFKPYRFMVSIRFSSKPNSHICAGTLIGSRMVLTATHCVHSVAPSKIVAVVGVEASTWGDIRTSPRIPVVAFREAPSDVVGNSSNEVDLAVLLLKTKQSGPIIALANAEPKVGGRVSAVGWGCTDKPLACAVFPSRLKSAEQVVLADHHCDTTVMFNPPAHGPTSICTKGVAKLGGNAATATLNKGDSGGPLLIGNATKGFVQAGVASLITDNPKKLYASFASVPRARSWIKQAVIALRAVA